MSWIGRTFGAWLGGWLGRISAALGGTHTDIVAAVISILSGHGSWITIVESRIPMRRAVWPYLMVYADWDRSARVTLHDPSPYDRTATIAVVGMLRLPCSGDTQTIEDQMDALASDIEIWLTTDQLRGVMAGFQRLALVHTGMAVMANHAEVTTLWNIDYATQEGAPGVLI